MALPLSHEGTEGMDSCEMNQPGQAGQKVYQSVNRVLSKPVEM